MAAEAGLARRDDAISARTLRRVEPAVRGPDEGLRGAFGAGQRGAPDAHRAVDDATLVLGRGAEDGAAQAFGRPGAPLDGDPPPQYDELLAAVSGKDVFH